MDKVDCWVVVCFNVMEVGWCFFVIYRGDNDIIELWEVIYFKKLFKKMCVIEFVRVGFLVLLKYFEFVFFVIGFFLIIVFGFWLFRLGYFFFEREMFFIVWEIYNGVEMIILYKVVVLW